MIEKNTGLTVILFCNAKIALHFYARTKLVK